VLFQATGSPAGIEFAGRHAEVVFTGGVDTAAVQANILAMRQKAIAHERDPAGLKFIVMAGVIVGRTDEEVSNKLDSYRKLMSVEASLAHAQSAVDLTAYPRDVLISDLIERQIKGWQSLARFKPQSTVGSVLAQLEGFNLERFFVAGTPSVVADEIEKWLDVDGIDGINLRQYLSFETARDFIELVIPELRRRGRFRERYNDGETLRERLFGEGQARLPNDHFGARYRDPAALSQPARPLRFPG
jgi:alkanesulfonate monooxygenase SsuD/methylene tetrahydromethanopterin reductase-like flavin-dependent oxidoreductase (luciferase family)